MDNNDTTSDMSSPLIPGDPEPEAMAVYGRILGIWLTVRNWRVWVRAAIRLVGKFVRILCAVLSLCCMGYATYEAGKLDLFPHFLNSKLLSNVFSVFLVDLIFGCLSYGIYIVLRLGVDWIDGVITRKISDNGNNLFWRHCWALLNGVARFILAIGLSVTSTQLGNKILDHHSHLRLMLLFLVAFILMILSAWVGDDMGIVDTIMCLCLGIIAYTFTTLRTWRMVAVAAIPSVRYLIIPIYALMWEWADQLEIQPDQEPLENGNQVPATQVGADTSSESQAAVTDDTGIEPIQEHPLEEEFQMLAHRDIESQAIVSDSQDLIEKLHGILNSLNTRGSR